LNQSEVSNEQIFGQLPGLQSEEASREPSFDFVFPDLARGLNEDDHILRFLNRS